MIHIWANTKKHPWFSVAEQYTKDSLKGLAWITKLKDQQPDLTFHVELLPENCGYQETL